MVGSLRYYTCRRLDRYTTDYYRNHRRRLVMTLSSRSPSSVQGSHFPARRFPFDKNVHFWMSTTGSSVSKRREKVFEVRVRVNNRSRYRADTRYYTIITGRTFRVCGGLISSKPEDDDDDANDAVMMTVTNAVYAK